MKPTQANILAFVRGQALKQCTQLNPWKSLGAISINWLLIIASILLHIQFPHPIIYIVTWFIISTRLYAFYSLIHDAIHYLIVRNKIGNDIIAQLFLGLPIFISLKQMRLVHLAHHKHLQTDLDPEMKHLGYKEFQFPKSKKQMVQLFLMDLFGINFIYYQVLRAKNILIHFKPSTFIRERVILFFFYLLIFVLAATFGYVKPLFLYWIIPYATLYQVLNRLRLATEHFNIDTEYTVNTRSVVPSIFEKWTLTPHNLGYHLEHHLYPGVPFYNLPKLHSMLMENPSYSSEVLVEKSYLNVIQKCIQ